MNSNPQSEICNPQLCGLLGYNIGIKEVVRGFEGFVLKPEVVDLTNCLPEGKEATVSSKDRILRCSQGNESRHAISTTSLWWSIYQIVPASRPE